MSDVGMYQRVRRATVGQSVLGWIATFCLMASGATWALMFRDLFTPTSILSAQALRITLLTIVFSFVLPLLVSMLAPTSPAGRLLQKTQWATVGYSVTICAALLLLYYGGYLTYVWFNSQPTIAESGQVWPLTISSLIGTVIVPALSWTVVTPEQWLAQIEQARQVRWIEREMQLEEATARAMHARALAILSNGIANATIEEKHELASIMLTFYRQQQKALQGVADTFANMHGVEMKLSLSTDDAVVQGYKNVVRVLDDTSDHMSSTVEIIEQSANHVNSRSQSYIPAVEESRAIVPVQNDNHVNSRPQSYIQPQEEHDPSLTYQGPPTDTSVIDQERYEREYVAAREKLDVLTKKKLAGLMEYSEQTAERRIRTWTKLGWIEEINLGRYKLTYDGGHDDE